MVVSDDSPDKITAMLDANRQTLESAVIDPANIEKLTQPRFARQIHQNFGVRPSWEVLGYVGPEQEQPGSEYSESFNPDSIAVIEGTIKSVGEFTSQGAAALVKLDVETKDGELVAVHCGPQQYINRMGFDFKPGSLITVTGSRIRIDNKPAIIATVVKVADKTLILRDNKGMPKW